MSLSYRLESYPHLQQALGPNWVREQEQIDPIESPYPLARWLVMDGFEPDLTTVDGVLGRLSAVSGIADRRKRIRADAPALMQTLTELYFGAWLLDLGYTFDWPKKGADFAVNVGTDQPLDIEVTTPRRAAWSEDLFQRLHLVALRTGYSANIEYSSETLPDLEFSGEIVSTVARQALDAIESPVASSTKQKPRHVVQQYPKFGIKISWTSSDDPQIRAITSFEPMTPYYGFSYLVAAARSKEHQMPEGGAGVLLVGTHQLPALRWDSFHSALLNPRPKGTLQFQWDHVPSSVKHVILYSMELRRIQPFKATWLVNPASPFPDSPGATRFFQDVFPYPLLGTETGGSHYDHGLRRRIMR